MKEKYIWRPECATLLSCFWICFQCSAPHYNPWCALLFHYIIFNVYLKFLKLLSWTEYYSLSLRYNICLALCIYCTMPFSWLETSLSSPEFKIQFADFSWAQLAVVIMTCQWVQIWLVIIDLEMRIIHNISVLWAVLHLKHNRSNHWVRHTYEWHLEPLPFSLPVCKKMNRNDTLLGQSFRMFSSEADHIQDCISGCSV